MFGWLFGSGDDSVHVREQDLDGTVWYIVDEYGSPWLETKTRLSKFSFIVKQETDYANHVSFRKSKSVDKRDHGPIARNLHDICRIYTEYEAMRVRSKTSFGRRKKWKYMTTDEGGVEEQIPERQRDSIDSALDEYSDLPLTNLTRVVREEYPEYSSTINEW